MKSRTVSDFWKFFDNLPSEIQNRAFKKYKQWRKNPFAGSLMFKRVSESEPVYSVRIGQGYRALGILEEDTVYWYFIGNHDEYEREIKRL
ncbi:MAG: hypothetical protein HC887_12930 [Desulfobacteraceae bacterium]|nr:hypothetical protein [Desulfobacteraceae bacterium]